MVFNFADMWDTVGFIEIIEGRGEMPYDKVFLEANSTSATRDMRRLGICGTSTKFFTTRLCFKYNIYIIIIIFFNLP